MKTIDAYRDLVKEIRGDKFRPVYVLHGEEPYFIDRISSEIEQRALQEHERDFNLTVLYGKDSNSEQVRDAALRYPMMAERQVVVLREAQQMRDLDKLGSYLEKATPTTVLIICHKHKKLDGRKAFARKASKLAHVFLSNKLRDHEMPNWIRAFVKHQERSIGPSEAQLLADHLGTDLSKVTNELEKLALVTPVGGKITAELIQQNVGISKEHNIFELQHAIGRKDVAKAHRIANFFASDPKDHPMPVTVAMLNSYFNRLALVHSSKSKAPKDLAALLKVNPFFVKDIVEASRNYPLGKVMNAQRHLRDADLKSKGLGNASTSDGDLLRELLIKVMD